MHRSIKFTVDIWIGELYIKPTLFPKWVMLRPFMVDIPMGILVICKGAIFININTLVPYQTTVKWLISHVILLLFLTPQFWTYWITVNYTSKYYSSPILHFPMAYISYLGLNMENCSTGRAPCDGQAKVTLPKLTGNCGVLTLVSLSMKTSYKLL